MADDADLAAIRDWVAQGGKITVDKEGNPVLPTGVLPSASSSAAADDEPTTTPAAPAASTPATPATTPTQPAQAKEPKQAPAQPKPPKQPKQRTGAPWYERLSDWIGERAANAPTPGGNLALLLLLLFFAFAIIPVNAGKTRLQLIWLVLTGGADLPGQEPATGPTRGQSALQAGATGGVLGGTGLGTTIGGGLIGGLIPTLSGGGPGGPNAAGYIPPSQQSGAGAGLSMSLLEPPR